MEATRCAKTSVLQIILRSTWPSYVSELRSYHSKVHGLYGVDMVLKASRAVCENYQSGLGSRRRNSVGQGLCSAERKDGLNGNVGNLLPWNNWTGGCLWFLTLWHLQLPPILRKSYIPINCSQQRRKWHRIINRLADQPQQATQKAHTGSINLLHCEN